MSDLRHHKQHRPHRLSLPPSPPPSPHLTTTPTTATRPSYPPLYTPTPTATPSKHRRLPSFKKQPPPLKLSSLFLLLFSLRSFYSLLPFLRSSPSFSLFPFSFFVSLSSFLLTLLFTVVSNCSNKDEIFKQPLFSLWKISKPQHRLLVIKAGFLGVVFLLRFQALRYCGTAATILAEFCGNVAARFVAESGGNGSVSGNAAKVRGFSSLCIGLFLLSFSWDRVECFPLLSLSNVGNLLPKVSCVRVWLMLLPFLSGFLGCYERVAMNRGGIRSLGRKRVRLVTLLFTTVGLFVPAVISFFLIEHIGDEDKDVSFGSLVWPLVNTVVFGVLLSESLSDERLVSSKDFQREFFVTFVCTVVLELFYFPEVSLFGLLLCGFLVWFSVRELHPVSLSYPELGLDSSESLWSMIMKPVQHILSERKSRKIALFLLINTGYMFVEFIAGFMSNSLGLISDACHMLFDCAALAIGLYASYISRLPANSQFNYGRGRFEVLSGYVNAVFLVLVGVLIVLESFERILDPQEVSTNSLLVVSIGGLLVNIVGLIFFHDEHHHAHGGGSCTHSHSHSHGHQHSDGDHSHHHGHGEHSPLLEPVHQHDHHNYSHEHDHQDHSHQHDHHDHSHQHDHQNHSHKHDHCNHSHEHDHHGNSHQSDHHDHSHQHDGQEDCHLHHHHDKGLESKHLKNSHLHDDTYVKENSHGYSHSTPVDRYLQSEEPTKERKLLKEPQKKHKQIDHNMEGIFLHVLADTMGSVGVVISTILIKYKGWAVADPACSIFISVMIVASVLPLLRNSAEILLQKVPKSHEQDLKLALEDVMKIHEVHSIENVNVWSLTNTEVVGTLHLYVIEDCDKASIKSRTSEILRDAGIKDLTVQMEYVRNR